MKTRARSACNPAGNTLLVTIITMAIIGGITNSDLIGGLFGLLGLGWFILTIVGGAKALQGDDWRNPVKHVIKLEVLKEK